MCFGSSGSGWVRVSSVSASLALAEGVPEGLTVRKSSNGNGNRPAAALPVSFKELRNARTTTYSATSLEAELFCYLPPQRGAERDRYESVLQFAIRDGVHRADLHFQTLSKEPVFQSTRRNPLLRIFARSPPRKFPFRKSFPPGAITRSIQSHGLHSWQPSNSTP